VIGTLMGLVLGGVLTGVAGWQSIFYVNIPIGIFATLWSHYNLKELGEIKKGQKIDVLGNFTFAGGLAAVLAAITLDAVSLLALDQFVLLLGTGVALLAAFVVIEQRVKEPMLDLALFRIRLFTAGTVASLFNSLARGAVTLVLTFYLQGPSLGLSALSAGIFLIPLSVSIALLGPLSGYLSDKHGPRFFATSGLIVSSMGFLLLSTIGRTIAFWQLALPLSLVGAGIGLFQSPNRASVMNSVPPSVRGIATGTTTTVFIAGGELQPWHRVLRADPWRANSRPPDHLRRRDRPQQRSLDRELHRLHPHGLLPVHGVPPSRDYPLGPEGPDEKPRAPYRGD